MRYTERHGGVAVIKDKSKHKEAMEKLAKAEDVEETGCDGCRYEPCVKQLLPCRLCKRDKEDKFERVVEKLEELKQNAFDDESVIISDAIEIVKEECGISE